MNLAKNRTEWLRTRGALAALVVIDAGLALTMRYSRTVAASDSDGGYAISTAVVCAEAAKLVSSVVLASREMPIASVLSSVFTIEALAMAVPAVLYALQNNLQYWAANMLDAPVYQVLYQVKIVTTAVCSVIMLGKHLAFMQWAALLLCLLGTSAVHLSALRSEGTDDNSSHGMPVAGLVAVLTACVTSALASVYTEKILKKKSESLWVRNYQLAVFCLASACIGCTVKDGAAIQSHGFFHGYSPVVWAVIFLVSVGGLTVAVVTKYTDSIIKNLAPACSIVLSCSISAIFFGFGVTPTYVFGAATTLTSVWMYVNNQLPLPSLGGGSASAPASASDSTTNLRQKLIAGALVVLLTGGFAASMGVGLPPPENGSVQGTNGLCDGAVAAFVLRAASDTLPPKTSFNAPEKATVAIYGSVLTKVHLGPVLAAIREADEHFRGDSVTLVVNCSNSMLETEIPEMTEAAAIWNQLGKGQLHGSLEMIPWTLPTINTLNEMQTVLGHIWKRQRSISHVVVCSVPFHLPRALLTTMSVIAKADTAAKASLRAWGHATNSGNLRSDWWSQEAAHSQGSLTGRRVDFISTEIERIHRYSGKGDLITPTQALQIMQKRDNGRMNGRGLP